MVFLELFLLSPPGLAFQLLTKTSYRQEGAWTELLDMYIRNAENLTEISS
jgi:hypothetical protein